MWDFATPAELKRLTDQIGNGVIIVEVCDNARFRLLSINQGIEDSTGLCHESLSGRYLDELLAEDERERVHQRYRACVESGEIQRYEESLRVVNGIVLWRTVLSPLRNAEGRIVRLMASIIDISDRYERERRLSHVISELERSESRIHSALRGGDTGIFEWHPFSQRLFVNENWAPNLKFVNGLAELSASEWVQRIHPDDRGEAIGAGERVLAGRTDHYTAEYRSINNDRDWRWLHVQGTVVERDDEGRVLSVCGTYRDITQQKRAREALHRFTAELEYQAVHDSMTGVLNHGAILEALGKEMERVRRTGGLVTLGLIDADHFKRVNDTYGHLVGDEVLVGLVERIRGALRPYDHLGRYGGEEFMVITVDAGDPAALHERVRGVVAEHPFTSQAGPIPVTVSVGVALFDGQTVSASQLVDQADRALYRAKACGRDHVVIAEPDAHSNAGPVSGSPRPEA